MYQLLLAKDLSTDNMTPTHEDMGSTPLNEALIILRDVLRQFRMKHRLDIVNTIIVHDGDSDGNAFYHTDEYKVSNARRSYDVPSIQRFDTASDRVTITDKKEKVSIVCPREYRGLQIALMKWVQTTTGCGVFGFYVTGRPADVENAFGKLYVNEQGVPLGYLDRRTRNNKADAKAILLDSLRKKLTEEKFVESYSEGYSRLYFIPGQQELSADNGVMVNAGVSKWTPSRLLSAFKKVNRKRAVSRVLVRRFIELIAV